MTKIATRPVPTAPPPTEAVLAAWMARSCEEQISRQRERLG